MTLDTLEMGTGTWQWGDAIWWGYNKTHTQDDAIAAFEMSLDHGVALIDTAEIYGQGKSEDIIGQALARERLRLDDRPVYIATKFAPLPYRISKAQFRSALKNSLERLRLHKVDLYQIHWTFPTATEELWADALADAIDAGTIGAAGVSNYNREQIIRSHHTLDQRGHGLVSNQVEYHLLKRDIERNGTWDACRERGISIIAYSPLAMGMLTGKYTTENPPPGLRGRKYRKTLLELPPLIALMHEIGAKHGDKTPAQVALNWVMVKGAIPIPGAKNASQVKSNAGALGWRLSDDDVAALDEMSDRITQS